jgi:hypothetical protein
VEGGPVERPPLAGPADGEDVVGGLEEPHTGLPTLVRQPCDALLADRPGSGPWLVTITTLEPEAGSSGRTSAPYRALSRITISRRPCVRPQYCLLHPANE